MSVWPKLFPLNSRSSPADLASADRFMAISLWETREQLEAVAAGAGASGIRDEGAAAVLTSLNLRTYEVALQA